MGRYIFLSCYMLGIRKFFPYDVSSEKGGKFRNGDSIKKGRKL